VDGRDVRCCSTFEQISDVGSVDDEGDINLDLFDVVRSCFRRWYIMIPLLLLTAWYAHQAYASVKPVYYSQAVIGLAPPSYRIDQAVAGQPVPRNGLLDIGGAPLLANMTALSLKQPTVVNRVVALGGMPDYIARMFPTPPNAQPIPLVMIENTASDPAASMKTLELVTNEMSSALEAIQRQANVPPTMMVNSFLVSPPSRPVAAMPTRTRATASIAVAGIGLSVLTTVFVDVLLDRRRKRVEERPKAASDNQPSPSPDRPSGDVAESDSDDPESDSEVPVPVRNDVADAR